MAQYIASTCKIPRQLAQQVMALVCCCCDICIHEKSRSQDTIVFIRCCRPIRIDLAG